MPFALPIRQYLSSPLWSRLAPSTARLAPRMPYSWSGIIPGTQYAIADAPITAPFSTFATLQLLLLLLRFPQFVCQQVAASHLLLPAPLSHCALPSPFAQRCHAIPLSACSKKIKQTDGGKEVRRAEKRRGTDICFYCKPIRRRQQSYLSYLLYTISFFSGLLVSISFFVTLSLYPYLCICICVSVSVAASVCASVCLFVLMLTLRLETRNGTRLLRSNSKELHSHSRFDSCESIRIPFHTATPTPPRAR